jgi:hypothetical protein
MLAVAIMLAFRSHSIVNWVMPLSLKLGGARVNRCCWATSRCVEGYSPLCSGGL